MSAETDPAITCLAAAASAGWVPAFVAWSNAESGLCHGASEREIATHRGLFALPRVETRHVAIFAHHAAGASRDPSAAVRDPAELAALLRSDEGDPDRWLERFAACRPMSRGNGRCGRALWMWRRLQRRPVPTLKRPSTLH